MQGYEVKKRKKGREVEVFMQEFYIFRNNVCITFFDTIKEKIEYSNDSTMYQSYVAMSYSLPKSL